MRTIKKLLKVDQAGAALQLSARFIYGLPPSTPGLYRFGRALRVDVAELRAWARAQEHHMTEAR
jgi:hypothetical protein